MPICIYTDCNQTSERNVHGYFCKAHYAQQQAAMPAKPRLSQPVQKVVGLDGFAVLAFEQKRIAAGRIVNLRRGALEPTVLRFWEPLDVH